MSGDLVIVAGGGGFIGGHLVADLLSEGHRVRSVDLKPFDEWYQVHEDAENILMDLCLKDACADALAGADQVYNLAADMGGMGFIENNKALCMLSVLINTHLLQAAQQHEVQRFFYSSSACVYAADKQTDPDEPRPEGERCLPCIARGWLRVGEALQRADVPALSRGLRIAHARGSLPQRLRPGGHLATEAGRRPPPRSAARSSRPRCRVNSQIEIWGDGEQTRSFMYIDDCIYGSKAILDSDILEPINLGSSEMVTINQLVDIVEEIAGIKLERQYDLSAPKGVRGRNSDNTMIQERLGWQPSISLRTGLEKTYAWIFDQAAALKPVQ